MAWVVNRTIHDAMLDQLCPDIVAKNMSEADREVLERERLRNATKGELGIFGEMQACFKGNTLMPGFLERDGAGQFVVDIGLGYDAQETRLAVKNGFVVFSFDLLPTNIRLIKDAVADDSRFVFVELQRQGDHWVVPELQQPPAGKGFAYVFNAAIADEETTVRFPENAPRSYTQSILDGKRNGAGIEVPVLPLKKFLPKWLSHIDYLKIDTQGYELKVMNGCLDMLQHTRYIAYEFSPWLMKRAHSGNPMELLQLLPRMGSLCYTASPAREHLRAGIPWPIETWYKYLDEGKSNGLGHNIRPNDPYGPWVDIFCYWPFVDAPSLQTAGAPPAPSGAAPMTKVATPALSDPSWVVNRTIHDAMLDQLCPDIVTKNMSEADREVLERERLRNATKGELGIFGEMQACFKGNTLMPGFLERDGVGQFVVDIGLGYDAQETRLAVKNGFVVFSFDLLPTNIRLIQDAVADDPRFVFVELQRQGDHWVVPELQQPPAGKGFAYVFNAAIADEETTVRFPENAPRSYTQSILDGKRNRGGIEVPVLPLKKFLPKWLSHIDYLKIDTQGYELKVMNGCLDMLQHTRYIAYEFSPWLMKRAHSGNPMELLQLLPRMGSLCYTASPAREHLRAGIPWPIETWYKYLDEGKSNGLGHNIRPNDPYGPWVDIFCYWPFVDAPSLQTAGAPPAPSGAAPMTQVVQKLYSMPIPSPPPQPHSEPQHTLPPETTLTSDPSWVVNRTIHDAMLDQLCPDIVAKNMSEADREVLERERLRNATKGELGIFGEMQACFKGNTLMPGFLERDGAGQFVVDIGLGYDAQETRLAVKNGFVVFSFDLLPTNIRLIKDAVADDSRFVFVELQRQGDHWVVPELQQPPAGKGFAYVFNAAIADEETTVRFPENAPRSYTQSILDGKRNRGGIEVPVLPLKKFLPKWLSHIDYLKIDTQGYELKVMNGCLDMLQHTRYIAYEFSPWLMKRAHSGNPMELLQLLPRMGSLCYTASPAREHLRAGIPWPIETWYKYLDEGKSNGLGHNIGRNDPYGPWVDIFCYWPFVDSPSFRTDAPAAGFFGITASETTEPDSHGSIKVAAGVVPFPEEWRTHEVTFLVGLFFGVCCMKCLRL